MCRRILYLSLMGLLITALIITGGCDGDEKTEPTPVTTPEPAPAQEPETEPVPAPASEPTPAEYTLSATISPPEAGEVSPSGGTYEEGEEVQLTATPASGYVFDHWGGDAEGTSNLLILTVDDNKSVTAYFKAQYILSTSVSPDSSGTIEPTGGKYDEGTEVTVSATAAAGYIFDHWSGDATGSSSSVEIIMESNINLTAYFNPLPTVIFKTDFITESELQKCWLDSEAFEGAIEGNYIEGDALHINPHENLKAHIITWSPTKNPQVTNFTLEVELEKIGGPDDTRYGIIFHNREFVITGDGHYAYRQLDWDSIPLQSIFYQYGGIIKKSLCKRGWWGAPPSSGLLKTSGPTSSSSWRYIDDEGYYIDTQLFDTTPTPVDTIPLTQSPHINTGNAINTLKVVYENEVVKLYANDKLLTEIEGEFASTLNVDEIGLVVQAPTHVAYYNMELSSILSN